MLEITVKDDAFGLHILTRDPHDILYGGTQQQLRHEAWVVFEFPKKYLESADFADIQKTIAAVLTSEADFESSKTKTVSLGQTREEVEAALGKPDKILDLGEKVTYVYKDIKVIFVNGKVVDVQ